ncbi:MAG: hypothetical protein EOP50_09405 [Sphingobacteriales bacterium]|nr:MAG: hypothetical protein EOP50_09405 [Sphingobacteriales bacterium]
MIDANLTCFGGKVPENYFCSSSEGTCTASSNSVNKQTAANSELCAKTKNLTQTQRKLYDCDRIAQINKISDTGNQIAQQVGAQVVTQVGSAAASKVANSSNVGDAYRATAKTASTTAIQQTTIGLGNAAAALLQMQQRARHKSALSKITELKRAAQSAAQTDPAAKFTGIPDVLMAGGKSDPNMTAKQAVTYLTSLEAEQKTALVQSNSGLMKSAMLTAGAVVNATTAKNINKTLTRQRSTESPHNKLQF